MSSTTAQTDQTSTATDAPKTDAPKRTTARKTTARKSTASKTTKTTATKKSTPATKKTGPSDRDIKRMVAQELVNMGAEWFASLPKRTVKGTALVTVNGSEYDRATVLASVKQVFGYTPTYVWNAKLGPRDVGRPASVKSAA